MATPLDVERARLRAEGYNEAEISQILILRAAGGGSQQPAGAAPAQGNMTGALGNASAALSHARGAIFGIRDDIRNVFRRGAAPLERGMSGAFLTFKIAIVVVLGFAIYQEWQQHIISATARAAADAVKAAAESRVAQETAQLKIDQAKWEMDKARAAYGTAIGHTMPEDRALLDKLAKEDDERLFPKENLAPRQPCPPGQRWVSGGALAPGCY